MSRPLLVLLSASLVRSLGYRAGEMRFMQKLVHRQVSFCIHINT